MWEWYIENMEYEMKLDLHYKRFQKKFTEK